jgi:uncharacterized protein YndB with AHSA1/START domain
MPSFQRATTAAAPPEEVWKVLYDPSRFPEWWAGVETVEVGTRPAGPGESASYTMYPTGYPTSRCRNNFRRSANASPS